MENDIYNKHSLIVVNLFPIINAFNKLKVTMAPGRDSLERGNLALYTSKQWLILLLLQRFISIGDRKKQMFIKK